MSYFNPHIYNKENLKEADRERLESVEEEFDATIYNAADTFLGETTGSKTVDKIRKQFVDAFCEVLKDEVRMRLQEYTVAIIEQYEDEVNQIENPTLFYGSADDYPHYQNTKGAQNNAD